MTSPVEPPEPAAPRQRAMPAQRPHRSTQDVETPEDFIAAVRARFGVIAWDLAATAATCKADAPRSYYGPGFEDTRRRVPDVSRARAILDWEPEVSLEDGLARTVEWWQKTNG